MPTARRGLATAVVGNALYAIGGSDGTTPCSGNPLATVERYDIDTDTWSTVAPLPSPRADLAAVAHGGNIYVFGGCQFSPATVTNAVDVYDPSTDTWSTAPADMPTARSSMYGAAAKGNRLYVIGGQVNFVQLATNEFYKVSADTWSTDTPMPSPPGRDGCRLARRTHLHGRRRLPRSLVESESRVQALGERPEIRVRPGGPDLRHSTWGTPPTRRRAIGGR